jgi:anaerobic selenocysteine-containing dehydrogenase
MFVGWGWNGMQSHQLPQAPRFLKQISEDPNRLLVIIDPRRSETAELADIHLAIRPGTDALLIKAMIAMILDNGLENLTYLENHAEGLTQIRALFAGFDSREAINVCELDYQQVATLCRLMTEKKWCLHPDLGIYMGRHSAINSYLLNILGTICGIFGVRGGNIVPGMVMPLGSHADERNDRVWRTVTTNLFPAAAGAFPPAVMPDEILSDHPQRVRAVYVNGCNPLRSYPDTNAYEKAFEKLDLLVVSDIVMSETARFAHYVLPCKNGYESWDASFFAWTYPEVYFQMRQPLVDAPGESKEASEIFTELADHLGIIPEIPQEVKEAAADVDQRRFALSLMKWAKKEPTIRAKMVFILARTLGQKWQSANKAALWGMLMTAPRSLKENAVRTGFTDSPELGQKLFAAIVENPQGLWIGQADTANPMAGIETKSGKVEMVIEELTETVQHLDARSEQEALTLPPEYPLILSAGRHMQCNANTLMRNPQWNEGKRACTVAINPEDASRLNLSDGEQVRVTTAAGFEIGELEVTDRVRPRTVLIPHGFGLVYEGKVFGLNVNRLTPGSNRDFLGTPLHRFIPCRLEKI